MLIAPGRDGVDELSGHDTALRYVAEAYKHGKPIGAIGEGVELLRQGSRGDAGSGPAGSAPSVSSGLVTLAEVSADGLRAFYSEFLRVIAGQHRHFDRQLASVQARSSVV